MRFHIWILNFESDAKKIRRNVLARAAPYVEMEKKVFLFIKHPKGDGVYEKNGNISIILVEDINKKLAQKAAHSV